MLGLPDSSAPSETVWVRTARTSKKAARRMNKAIMKSHHFQIHYYDMPLRLRTWFVLFTALILVGLALLGFTNFSHALPLNDKVLHFFCMGFSTGVFYFIFDVEEDARRIWFWRNAPLVFTGVICFFLGGIVSEFVQSMLPYKEFQVGDVAANLLGSTVGLYISYHLEKYYRHRREISRLYRPLDMEVDPMSEEDEDDEDYKPTRLSDVWDEREELFDIGDESDEELNTPRPHAQGSAPPKIVVTED